MLILILSIHDLKSTFAKNGAFWKSAPGLVFIGDLYLNVVPASQAMYSPPLLNIQARLSNEYEYYGAENVNMK